MRRRLLSALTLIATLGISLQSGSAMARTGNASIPANPAKAVKTLNVLVTTPESSFDPALASDITTLSVNENLFEPMLRYDYLARPLKLKPNTLRAMPEISADGKTYTLRLQAGIFFSEDAAFGGKRRELQAADYAYAIQRMYDPALKSPWLFMFEGKLQGDEALRGDAYAKTVKSGKQSVIAGIQVVDRYTLRLRLQAPDPNFLFILATPATGAVAREVMEFYGNQAGNHPVGTGPFRLGEWKRSFQLNLIANPDYRRPLFDGEATQDAYSRRIAESLRGKSLPLVQRIRISVVEEQQARVLGFLNREFDSLEQVPAPLSEMVMRDGQLKPELSKQGIQLRLFSPLQTYYVWMNMEDPVLGGYTPDKIALRRAIALSYNHQQDIAMMEKGLAQAAQSPLAPNVIGYDPEFRSPVQFNPVLANALLDKFGYQRGPDQYRRLPDGQPLELTMHTQASTTGRLRDEVWRKNMEMLGIRISFKSDKHSEILRAARLGKVQMTEANWVADFPDGENFFQLLYGPNTGRANYARFNLPEYNRLFEQSRRMADGPERRTLYRQMSLYIHAYNPWILRTHPLSADVQQPWLMNFQRHPVDFTNWRYLDIAPDAKQNMK